MHRPALTLICVLAVLTVAACGGDDEGSPPEGPLARPELAAAADVVCREADARFARSGPRGITNAGLAAEFENTSEIVAARQRGLEELEPAAAVEDPYRRFLEGGAGVLAADRAVAEAAAADDEAGVDAAFADLSRAADTRDRAAARLGMDVCGGLPEPKVEETGTGPPGDASFAEPSNTVDEALEDYLAAAKRRDCRGINEAEHSDNGRVGPKECASLADAYAGAKVLLTEQYGPAGAAELKAPGQPFTLYFVEDTDGVLRRGGDIIVDDGGLRPANDGIDADDVAADTVEAIREEDTASFNETLSVDDQSFEVEDGGFDSIGNGAGGADLVEAIRDDEGAAPEPLGVNQAYAFYLLDTEGKDFVLLLVHEPGSRTAYRFRGFFPIKPS